MQRAQKVMLLGDIGVGKTSLARRLVLDRFEASYKATIGVDMYRKDILLDDGQGEGDAGAITLIIWDIDGDFGESIFQHIYIRGASSALIIGDAHEPSSFESMLRLADGFQEQLPGRPIALVINKVDLASSDRQFSLPSAFTRLGAPVIKTSARTGENVTFAFRALAKLALARGV
jgi:small GTP-binding protein